MLFESLLIAGAVLIIILGFGYYSKSFGLIVFSGIFLILIGFWILLDPITAISGYTTTNNLTELKNESSETITINETETTLSEITTINIGNQITTPNYVEISWPITQISLNNFIGVMVLFSGITIFADVGLKGTEPGKKVRMRMSY
jgi:hypothetical protein